MVKLLFLVLVASAVTAAEPKVSAPTIDGAATPAQVAVGDPVTVTLTWTWPSGWQASREPDPAVDYRDCFVTDAPPVQTTHTAEGERRSLRLTLLANRSGAWALPRPTLTVSGPQGAVTLTAPAVIVQVGAEAAPAKLPEPIALRVRPPASATADQRWWWIGGGAAVVIVGVALVLLRRRREATVIIPPAERFAAELRQLGAITDSKELGAGISLALRRYAGDIYRFDGAGATTREVAAQVQGRGQASSDDERRQLVRLLERLDDLRWAAGDLDLALVRPLTDDAGAWVATVERRLAAERAAAAAKNAKPAEAAA
jgi:hypothetical protein